MVILTAKGKRTSSNAVNWMCPKKILAKNQIITRLVQDPESASLKIGFATATTIAEIFPMRLTAVVSFFETC